MASKVNIKMEDTLFAMIGKRFSDAMQSGEISPEDVSNLILSSDLSSLKLSDVDERQYISNLVNGSNISGY
tara:strand:+ start:136 stop:348 length:213 start_codon:yes stop_codon:yes gene_type:complete